MRLIRSHDCDGRRRAVSGSDRKTVGFAPGKSWIWPDAWFAEAWKKETPALEGNLLPGWPAGTDRRLEIPW